MKTESLKIIEDAERRMKRDDGGNEHRRTGGVTAFVGNDDGDEDFSTFEDDGDDGTMNARRPKRIEDIDVARVYARFNGKKSA